MQRLIVCPQKASWNIKFEVYYIPQGLSVMFQYVYIRD